MTIHCNKIEGWEHLSKADGLAVLNYVKEVYFGKFLLRKMFDRFAERQTEEKVSIYVETPNFYFNDETTPFTDLSKKEDEKPKEEPKAS